MILIDGLMGLNAFYAENGMFNEKKIINAFLVIIMLLKNIDAFSFAALVRIEGGLILA